MLLGMEVGVGPGDFVFDGDPATPEKRAHPPHPIFSPCLLWPNGSHTHTHTNTHSHTPGFNRPFSPELFLVGAGPEYSGSLETVPFGINETCFTGRSSIGLVFYLSTT